MENLKSVTMVRLRSWREVLMELKVFTLPTCPTCPTAKSVTSSIAQKLGVTYREVNLATEEGLKEGRTYDIMSTPSIVLDDEVIVRGRLIAGEKLEEEVKKRLEKWRERALTQ
jgi:glutaredoxin